MQLIQLIIYNIISCSYLHAALLLAHDIAGQRLRVAAAAAAHGPARAQLRAAAA